MIDAEFKSLGIYLTIAILIFWVATQWLAIYRLQSSIDHLCRYIDAVAYRTDALSKRIDLIRDELSKLKK